MKKFLIGQLARYGDCLYATVVAKQIKNDYPDSHITWAVLSRYKSILDLNPYIDEIWEIPLPDGNYSTKIWDEFEIEAIRRKNIGIYDELVFTQFSHHNWNNFDGTIRSSTFNGYKNPITISVSPVVCLSENEVSRVAEFISTNKISDYKEVVLFECAPGSGQSFVTVEFALNIANEIISKHKNICFILTSPNVLGIQNPQIIDASQLSFRENAELIKYCTLLVGCSSGISWLSTSDWIGKKINTVQLLKEESSLYAGMSYDFMQWQIGTENIIEITDCDENHVVNCLNSIFLSSFSTAKKEYNVLVRPSYYNFESVLKLLYFNGDKRYILGYAKRYHKKNKHLNLLKLYLKAFYIYVIMSARSIKNTKFKAI